MFWFNVFLCSPGRIEYRYLNTSYVLVQPNDLRYEGWVIIFKYILCFGSTKKKQQVVLLGLHLNTSYVLVQQQRVTTVTTTHTNLNTSYVLVQLFLPEVVRW